MAQVTQWLKLRPLNNGQGHSFWYPSISHNIRLPIDYVNSIGPIFCSRMHCVATIQMTDDDDRRTDATIASFRILPDIGVVIFLPHLCVWNVFSSTRHQDEYSGDTALAIIARLLKTTETNEFTDVVFSRTVALMLQCLIARLPVVCRL